MIHPCREFIYDQVLKLLHDLEEHIENERCVPDPPELSFPEWFEKELRSDPKRSKQAAATTVIDMILSPLTPPEQVEVLRLVISKFSGERK